MHLNKFLVALLPEYVDASPLALFNKFFSYKITQKNLGAMFCYLVDM